MKTMTRAIVFCLAVSAAQARAQSAPPPTALTEAGRAVAPAGKPVAVVMTNGDEGGALAAEITDAVARICGWPSYQSLEKNAENLVAALKPQSAGRGPAAATPAVAASSRVLEDQPALAVAKLAGALKQHEPRRGATNGKRNQVYMLDLVTGETTLISDEPVSGLTWSGSPEWSHDGSRIVFDASPGVDFSRSRLMSIEVRDGRPAITDLGPGNCPTFAPEDEHIAFLLNSGEVGLWMMQADGSQRRRAGEIGVPSWSADGRGFLTSEFGDFQATNVMNCDKVTWGKLAVPGYRTFSRPSWAGPGMLVSALSTKQESDTIALLDASNPAEAKVIEVLWRRSKELDVTPRWPVYRPETRRCYFMGGEWNKRVLYSIERGKSLIASRVQADGQEKELKAFSFSADGRFVFSPDGRYILFDANRQ